MHQIRNKLSQDCWIARHGQFTKLIDDYYWDQSNWNFVDNSVTYLQNLFRLYYGTDY